MCEQCVARVSQYLGPNEESVLPGFVLVRAAKDGWIMQKGDWGLVHCNDPDYWWSLTPVEDPCYGLTDEQINARTGTPEDELFDDFVVELRTALDGRTERMLACSEYPRFDDAVRLHEAATQAGYSPKEHGSFGHWLAHHLAVFLKTAKEHPDETPEP
jgi:hypothetical protein